MTAAEWDKTGDQQSGAERSTAGRADPGPDGGDGRAASLNGLVNLRDLGGLPIDDGVQTAYGVLYRSDAPYEGDVRPDGIEIWPPRVVIDLRDRVEAGPRAHPLAGPETTVYQVPLIEELHRAEDIDAWLSLPELYQEMVKRAAHRLVQVFGIIANADGPALVHCAAGKDRTGVVSAIMLRTAGVRPDAVVTDYVHTDHNMFRVLQRLNVAPTLPPGVDEESVRHLDSAPAEAITGVLDKLDEHRDGVDGWLLENGASTGDIQRFKDRFIA